MLLHGKSFRNSHVASALQPTSSVCHSITTIAGRRTSSSLDHLPSIPTSPPATCACLPMPEGLAIDYERQMSQTMPPYAQHVVIRTGRNDWSSRIEDEATTLETDRPGGGNLARDLKRLVGRGGKYHNVRWLAEIWCCDCAK